jgi:ribosomal-protein-alanine N-acetyltransferase
LAHDTYNIERMTPSDLREVLEIERACFRTPWGRRSFMAEIESPGRSFPLVLRVRSQGRRAHVLGYVCVWRVQEEMWVNNLAVHPSHRCLGLGTRLLQEALDLGRQLGCECALLEVRPSNREARRLYRREGFHTVGLRKGYYSDDLEDALVMTAHLRPRPRARHGHDSVRY